MPKQANRILVKLRPSGSLRAAESRANLRPLYDTPPLMATGFGIEATAQWFVADLPDGAETPWDLAHARVAGQLGVAESDVMFAEPDIVHDVYRDAEEEVMQKGFGATEIDCTANPQDATRGKKPGQGFAWHLGDAFTQLGAARNAVPFAPPRTRIAHIDTGYYRTHVTRPKNVLQNIERNFVERDDDPNSAQDPNNERAIFDNSGHGTGTLSILAGGLVAPHGIVMGGAPEADIVPLRVADSVVLLRTSSLARALAYAIAQHCDVITMSMGGLPSRAWAEAVDKVYEAGICFCAAGGNRTRPLPPSVLVYPARYPRVIAVLGVMNDGSPYKNLDRALEGSFGPDGAMKKALAAYTPNIPWARFGCDNIVRLNGEGTSSATPQVAAAAALWFEKYKTVLPRDWRRVEAVRRALYSTATNPTKNPDLGNGIIKANAALAVKPVLSGLPQSARSSNSFAFLRLITGLGITEAPPREQMFNLELAQRWLMSDELQKIVGDPEDTSRLEGENLRKAMEVIIEDQAASIALRKHVAARYPVGAGGQSAPPSIKTRGVVPENLPACDPPPAPRTPPYRRLRVYAVDPSLSTRLATAGFNEVTLPVRWEELKEPGKGEYLVIADNDASGHEYAPVDLNTPALLAQDGWAPSEGNPQFHQQMVYAVAMKTISHFEKALGRPVLWRHFPNPQNLNDDSGYAGQLAVCPHALRQANAFYSPNQVALLFGYFDAAPNDPREHMPGSRVYSCLSHDIIAHETTHAILDGMYRRFNEPTNPDVLAFHEGFADVVALMQHFTIPELLESQIAKTRGDFESESILGSLAVQFGEAMGGRGALRNAIGSMEDGKWKRFEPDPADLQKRLAPHARGAVLVAAVFDAFIAIYKSRIADLLRIYTGGTGVLPTGSIHPDLVGRLADEATKSANHVLTMCIRALDYLPPVDITFFEYLRALITADYDLVRDDRHNYRVAFVEAFRRRGIYPIDVDDPARETVRTLSVDTLRWQGVEVSQRERYKAVAETLKRYADLAIYLDSRETLFKETRAFREDLHGQLKAVFTESPDVASELGLDSQNPSFEVHALRSAMRATPEGKYIPQIILMLTQSKKIDEEGREPLVFRGGATLVVDLSMPEVKYRIFKRINSDSRQARTAKFVREAAADPLRALFLTPDGANTFSALHALADEGF